MRFRQSSLFWCCVGILSWRSIILLDKKRVICVSIPFLGIFIKKTFLQLLEYGAFYLRINSLKNKSTFAWQTESFSSLTSSFTVLKHYCSGPLYPPWYLQWSFWYWFHLEMCSTAVVTSDFPVSHWNVYVSLLLRSNPRFVFWRWSLSLKFSLLFYTLYFISKRQGSGREHCSFGGGILYPSLHNIWNCRLKHWVKYIVATAGLWKAFFHFTKKFCKTHAVLSQLHSFFE